MRWSVEVTEAAAWRFQVVGTAKEDKLSQTALESGMGDKYKCCTAKGSELPRLGEYLQTGVTFLQTQECFKRLHEIGSPDFH